VSGGLVVLVLASVVISLGLAPVFGLTTELIVGAAPQEQTGAASGISETGSELGGALGVAILGSLGVAIYRAGVATALPAGVPASVAAAAKDTLGGAVGVSASLPPALGEPLLAAARTAFVDGLHVTAAIAAIVGFGLALFALRTLREPGEPSEAPEECVGITPRLIPVAAAAVTPPRECF
jgi:MFS transporter, DHA2 family, multidrug resistance protein